MYRFVPDWILLYDAVLVHTSIRKLCPSGKAPIAFVRCLILRLSRLIVTLVLIFIQFRTGNFIQVRGSMFSVSFFAVTESFISFSFSAARAAFSLTVSLSPVRGQPPALWKRLSFCCGMWRKICCRKNVRTMPITGVGKHLRDYLTHTWVFMSNNDMYAIKVTLLR